MSTEGCGTGRETGHLQSSRKQRCTVAVRYCAIAIAVQLLALAVYFSLQTRSGVVPDSGRRLPEVVNPTVVFNTTRGSFAAELYLDRMPITVSNFVDLCQSGFYDGLHFHRVIKNFMIQFGCPYSKDMSSQWVGRGGPEEKPFKNLITGKDVERLETGNIEDEFLTHDGNEPGTLSMANAGVKNSGGSQFFINVVNNSFLNWWRDDLSKSQHPVFGKVIENYAVVEAISKSKTVQDRPEPPVMMHSCSVSGVPSEVVSS
mmetsp:Transcript_56928/g.133742  ORF Transcript_56928/g.133742 Transcript_56928/m.133742 type:complete len:259 (-) Transcript_56928:26-802(-)